jgi:hypothetical protein
MAQKQRFRRSSATVCKRKALTHRVWASGLFGPLTLVLAALAITPACWAIPSFSRQTGLPCNACHYTPPELTPLGRIFKLSGYDLIGAAKDSTIGDGKTLQLLKEFPLSVAFTLSDSSLEKMEPGTQNGSAEFPQDLSLYLAGALAPRFGVMLEAAYNHANDHFGMGIGDLRYANSTKLAGKDLVYGLDLNNQPTLEDIWNSTPAWGFPWIGTNITPGPIAAPVIAGALAQDVAGVGAYGMFNNHLYADVTLYRSEHAGGALPLTGTGYNFNIVDAAPYWRVAWQQTVGASYFEVGTYGIFVNSYPGAVSGPEDRYVDPSFDFSYERPFGLNALSVHGTWMHEKSNMGATFAAGGAAQANHHLNTERMDATWYVRSRFSATGAFFTTSGNSDPPLYAAAPLTGSATGAPTTTGYTLQGGYWPVQNIDLTVAYTGFSRFNGAGTNYDGSGRNATDNNTVYVAAWFNF